MFFLVWVCLKHTSTLNGVRKDTMVENRITEINDSKWGKCIYIVIENDPHQVVTKLQGWEAGKNAKSWDEKLESTGWV